MKSLKKSIFISLIFLFLFSFITLLFIPITHAATNTTILSQNRTLQPVQGSWYYDERNCFIDFERYLEGSTPNLTSGGTIDETDITGVYKYGSNLYADMMPSTIPEIETLQNLTHINEYSYNTGFNNSNASWENITILNNNSIMLNTSGHFNGAPNSTDIVGSLPAEFTNLNGITETSLNISDDTLFNTGKYHLNVLNCTDDTVNYAEVEYNFNNPFNDGKIEFWLSRDDYTTYGVFVTFYDGASIPFALRFGFGGNKLQVLDSTGWHNIAKALHNEKIYNFEFWFDCGTDTFFMLIDNALWHANASFSTATSDIDRIVFAIDTPGVESLYIDGLAFENWDKSVEINDIYYENYYLENTTGYYLSDVVVFNSSTEVLNIDYDYTNMSINSTINLYVSDNNTGSFDNWMNYTDYIGNSTQYLKYMINFSGIFARNVSIFNNVSFFIQSAHLYQPFINEYDQILLFYPMKDPSLDESEFYYRFNISDGLEYLHGELELVFLHAFYPDFLDNASTGHEFFTILLNDESQFKFALQSCYNDTSLDATGNWSVWMNDDYQFIDSVDYHYHQDTTDSFKDFYFYTYSVIIEYWYNSKVSLRVSELTSLESAEYRFENTTDVFHNGTDSSITQADFYFGSNKTNGNAMMIGGIDSSRMAIDYQRNQILDIVTKNLTAYNIEEVISFQLPRASIYEDSFQITQLRLKSELEADTFISFICDAVIGGVDETFTNLDSYQVITSFTTDTEYVPLNIKYRCKNLNEFNNTIYLEITYFYIPHDPTFIELMISAIPGILILIIPSSVAYSKFKRTGFLFVLLLMTIITMAIGMIPIVVGLIMIAIIIVVFLKIMNVGGRGGNDEGEY